MTNCSTKSAAWDYPTLGTNGAYVFEIEELNAAGRGGIYDYPTTANQALKRVPGSLDRFLKASLAMKFGSFSSALHGNGTFPKVMKVWGDADFTESVNRLSVDKKEIITERLNHHDKQWRRRYPLTSEILGNRTQ
jgi:hypothetical protein